MRAKSLMSLKVWSKLGLPEKNSKSPYVGRFSVNHAKSNLSLWVSVVFRIIFLKFTQKRDLASSTSEQAKHRLRKTQQTNYSLHERSQHRERARQAQSSQIKQPSIELRQPSTVFASKAQSEQIKQIRHVSRSELRQPSAVFANQLKQASQALSTLAERANQASYARASRASKPPDPLQQTTTSLAYWSS